MSDEPDVTSAAPPPTSREVLFIGGAWHAKVHSVELGPHGDSPELVLPPVWHDLATGTSYALRNVNMVLRDMATGASKGAFDMPLMVALDVADNQYVALVSDAAMQYTVSHLGQVAEVPAQAAPAGSNGHHVRPSGLIVPPGRG